MTLQDLQSKEQWTSKQSLWNQQIDNNEISNLLVTRSRYNHSDWMKYKRDTRYW